MKRILSMLLTLTLTAGLLSGCQSGGTDQKGGGGNAEVPMGRYIETSLGVLPGVGWVRGARQSEDGGISAYGQSRSENWFKRIQISAAGEMTMTDVPWLTALLTTGSNVYDVADGPDGLVYVLYQEPQGALKLAASADGASISEIAIPEWEEWARAGGNNVSGGMASQGVVADQGGVSFGAGSSITFEGDEEGDAGTGGEAAVGGSVDVAAPSVGSSAGVWSEAKFPTGFYLLEGGDYLVLFGSDGAVRYSAVDGKRLQNYPCVAFKNTTAVYGNKLLAIDTNYSALWSYDLDTGKQAEVAFENLDYDTLPGMDGEGLFLTAAGGIYRQAEGGSLWERLVDGELTSLSIPNMSPVATLPRPDGGFLVFLTTDDGAEVMEYTYSADTPTNPDTELTIAGLSDSSTVRQAIGEFQRRNSNVKVNYQILLEEGSSATVEDVIRSLNTELLGGKGPDLLVLDGLPYESYIEKGVLKDLSELRDALADEGLMTNLTGGYERSGGVYALPTRFTLPVMLGKAEDVAGVRTLEDLADRVEAGQGEENPFLRVPDGLWQAETGGIAPQFVKLCGPTDVEEESLDAFLTALQRLDTGLKANTPESNASAAFMVVAVSSGRGQAEAMDMGVYDLRQNRGRFHVQELGGVFGLKTIADNLPEQDGWRMDTLFGEKQFYPVASVGVVTTSSQQELAGQFMAMLLSRTVQDKYLGDGFSVNRASLQKSIEELADGAGGMDFPALAGALDTPVLRDQVIQDAVTAQAKDLLDGKLTAAEATGKVMEKTRLYLAE